MNDQPTRKTISQGGGSVESPCPVRVAEVLCMAEPWGVVVYYRSALEGVVVFVSVRGHESDFRYREVEVWVVQVGGK